MTEKIQVKDFGFLLFLVYIVAVLIVMLGIVIIGPRLWDDEYEERCEQELEGVWSTYAQMCLKNNIVLDVTPPSTTPS